ncbi:hypothetical protein [Arthrobacter castelli]|uniref:hypothetical protein n=1 Tax=Arthrobacter castelli TaxID=271431 RepID=UPI000409EA54|nr:hypothetical protein [Arthrobacter castelli]
MGLTKILADVAVRATQVLVVEVPGQWLTRVELEQQMLCRGWRRAWTPADADVLAVCGVPGPELAEIVDRLWEQMPGPRVRADTVSPKATGPALDETAVLLLDTGHHRTDARQRTQSPRIPEDHSQMDHGGHESDAGHGETNHGGHDGMSGNEGQDHGGGHEGHQGHGDMGHEGHESMEHGDHEGDESHEGMGHEGHGGMDHSGHGGHEGMGHGGHGGMDMAPEGIALAQGGPDRDGLEMDVLHLPLGPVLPFWPAGLVLDCSLQGDVVVDAAASVVDGHDHGAGAGGSTGVAPAAAVWCDGVMALLALTGADDAAARSRQARDALLRGDPAAARKTVVRLHRSVRRSWLLRWSLRGVLRLDQSDLERHGLPVSCRGDAYERLLSMVERIRAGLGDTGPVSEEAGVVPWQMVPHLVTGLELSAVRLAVASLYPGPFPAAREVGHA